GVRPDVLIMTATPIPRTLALTLYGDLNVSIIDELPPGRSPIQTHLFYGKQRERAYHLVERELAMGRQAYVVCPLVEESEKVDLKAAIEMSAALQKEVFPHRRIGLLHGKLKREEKESIMREFKEGRIDLLVATTVVEVGIDVSNATVMLIEHVERFGLSQLHQLRGRVGRGKEQSYCLMVAEFPLSQEGRRRLEAMVKSNDGFKIAEIDLEIRGPGEFFGTRQSGLPELRVANLARDIDILEAARQEAFEWIERDPNLDRPESRPIRSFLERKWKGKLEWLTTG
ncbi:MAG TPA: helicase-related protein, partial [Candidatus Manganitrophaceae bacterium]